MGLDTARAGFAVGDSLGEYPALSIDATDDTGDEHAAATVTNRVKLAKGEKLCVYHKAKCGSNSGSYAYKSTAIFGISIKRTGTS